MVGGAALLVDVHYPERPNGAGVLFLPGSGWHVPEGYDAPPIKEHDLQLERYVAPLVAGGYTLFVANHRAAPLFRYPAPVEDARRALRYVRHHAARFAVDPARLAAAGASSGANLAALLGTLDGAGDPAADDPVERASAAVGCVVGVGTPADLTELWSNLVGSYLGRVAFPFPDPESTPERALYREASPAWHVDPGDASMLLLHGDRDRVIPVEQSEILAAKLRAAGVPVEVLRFPKQGHMLILGEATRKRVVEWLEGCLERAAVRPAGG